MDQMHYRTLRDGDRFSADGGASWLVCAEPLDGQVEVYAGPEQGDDAATVRLDVPADGMVWLPDDHGRKRAYVGFEIGPDWTNPQAEVDGGAEMELSKLSPRDYALRILTGATNYADTAEAARGMRSGCGTGRVRTHGNWPTRWRWSAGTTCRTTGRA